MLTNSFVLTLSCHDRPGIVAAVTSELAAVQANIEESNQFWDRETNRFFMRIVASVPREIGKQTIADALASQVDRLGIDYEIRDRLRKPKVIIMVSKFDHALLHLLYQIRVGWLRAEVIAIVSNHPECRGLAEMHGIYFHYLPVSRENKAQQEERLLEIVRQGSPELVILARYMQVFSDSLSRQLYGKAINIHHSFLPSFKGAKPYHQAFERGVKLIGATAHYVTSDLDEGPIIEQETERVTHAMSAEDLVATGRDIESRVLSRAVKLHLESRVVINGHKTIVF